MQTKYFCNLFFNPIDLGNLPILLAYLFLLRNRLNFVIVNKNLNYTEKQVKHLPTIIRIDKIVLVL